MEALRGEPSSSFLLLLNFVYSKFSAQSARVGVVRDGSTNLGFQHRAFCNSRTAMADFY
ncbi:hypothetical protein F2Q69_00014226 [Brassica cretica]|uniref:Uncharacterized protein n=2 Tax=Brassica TaxID=3705 RepID=A0A0D3BW59_BRAOL|nr:hypothetical protein F2Q69_00014226 [Brassica cretica]